MTKRTTSHVVFQSGEREILGCARGYAALDRHVLFICKLRLKDTRVHVVPESFQKNFPHAQKKLTP